MQRHPQVYTVHIYNKLDHVAWEKNGCFRTRIGAKCAQDAWIKSKIPLSSAYRADFLHLDLKTALDSTTPLLVIHGDRDRSVPLERLGLRSAFKNLKSLNKALQNSIKYHKVVY